ncbi:hypothetical protein D3C78_1543760 [compost metagenome]
MLIVNASYNLSNKKAFSKNAKGSAKFLLTMGLISCETIFYLKCNIDKVEVSMKIAK